MGLQTWCKTMYLLNKRQARILPVWDVFHKWSNMTLNAYKEAGLWPSIKLQSFTFEVNRGALERLRFLHSAAGGHAELPRPRSA